MVNIPETRESLILRAADQRDFAAWEQFARIYGPVAYSVARRIGLQDADAEDVAQQIQIAVSRVPIKVIASTKMRDSRTKMPARAV